MTEPAGEPTIRVIAMPADANPYGDIFGGWLLSWMDSAAAMARGDRPGGRAVTIAMDGVEFLEPVYVGDELSVYARLAKTGRTSMTIEVEAWRRPRHGNETARVTQARLIFVAIDENRQPRPVPTLAA